MFPAPNRSLLPFAVAAPELAPVLFIAALLVGFMARKSSQGTGLMTGFLLLATMGLAALPMAQWLPTRRQFDTATADLAPLPPADPTLGNISITRGIVFAEPAGGPLKLDLYRPATDKLSPVVIQIYGGAWQNGGPEDDARFASEIARRGFVVAAIDYRHAPTYPWPAQIDDVRSAVDWVITHARENGGDPRHIALVGRSSGAQLALVEAYTEPARIDAVVSFYGPTDLTEGWKSPPTPDPLPVRPALEAFLGGTPDTVPTLYTAASPITYVARRVPPTLLIYGGRDHVVDSQFGRELHDKLKAAGASSIFLEIPWAEHTFDSVPGLSARLTQPYVERFLLTNLQ